jgi:hypothetical protein
MFAAVNLENCFAVSRPGAEAGNSITQSLSKYIFMRLNYSFVVVCRLEPSHHDDALCFMCLF